MKSVWRAPSDVRSSPTADAIAVAPATFNTVNKWAAGFADSLALGIRREAPGMGIPTACPTRTPPSLPTVRIGAALMSCVRWA